MRRAQVPGVASAQTAVFPAREFERRQDAARAGMDAAGLDVLVVTSPENIFYLCGQQTPGYSTFQAMVMPRDGDPVFVVRQLELANFIASSHVSDILVYQDDDDPSDFLVAALRDGGWASRRIGIDKKGFFLPVSFFERLQSSLGDLRDGSGVVERGRMVKSPLEQDKLRRAAKYVDAAQRAAFAAIPSAGSENDVVAAMVGAAIEAGGEYVGMEPLVSAGRRTGIPHLTWRRGRLRPGDNMILEPSCCHDRYHAVMMRSAVLGSPSPEFRGMYDVALEGLEAALAAIRPGNTCEDVHVACQKVVDGAGLTDAFRKRVGYSIGIAFAPGWDEGPILGLYHGVKVPLEPGMCFHLPVALRKWGEFTVGVSESVIVTDDGHEVLGTIPRELPIFG